MSNFTRVIADKAPSATELEQMRSAVEAPPAVPQVRTGGSSSIAYSGGVATYRLDGGAIRVEVPHRNPDLIEIHGIQTTRAAAEAAGLLPTELNLGKPQDGGETRPLPPLTPEAAKATDATPTDKAAGNDPYAGDINGATDALTRAASRLGAETVEAHLMAAAEAGEIPQQLPDGVTPADAQAAMAGYTAQAERALQKVGATVAMVEWMLTPDEITEARRATVANNTGLLEDLGKKAQRRLEMLPVEDPEGFQRVLAKMSTADREMVRKRNDKWVVDTGYGETTMSWGLAVREGLVQL